MNVVTRCAKGVKNKAQIEGTVLLIYAIQNAKCKIKNIEYKKYKTQKIQNTKYKICTKYKIHNTKDKIQENKIHNTKGDMFVDSSIFLLSAITTNILPLSGAVFSHKKVIIPITTK